MKLDDTNYKIEMQSVTKTDCVGSLCWKGFQNLAQSSEHNNCWNYWHKKSTLPNPQSGWLMQRKSIHWVTICIF